MRTKNIALSLIFLSIISVTMVGLGQMRAGKAADSDDEFQLAVSSLKDKKWTQVNREPYYISSQLAGLCRMATPADHAAERKQNPHAGTYITVFVNQAGRAAMFSSSPQQFPEGAVIVKTKFDLSRSTLLGSHDSGPMLYTVMIKRRRGYNPEAGDWEFGVVSGDGKRTGAAGKLANCMACHTTKPDSDFVFRSYLTPPTS